jgi:mannose-6-phosphate isomerase
MFAVDRMGEAARRLKRWLFEQALPLWWERGADHRFAGGFYDSLDPSGVAPSEATRVRVQARQAHVYALAAQMGWPGPAETASLHGLTAVRASRDNYGFYRRRIEQGATGGMGLVYDQSFVLLALASHRAAFWAHRAAYDGLEPEAELLVAQIADCLQPRGGYTDDSAVIAPLFANPNMHLFEAFQAWARTSGHPRWAERAASLARLGLDCLIDTASGALAEEFGSGWATAQTPVYWPGHLYEWGFLLLDWPGVDASGRLAALRLIEVAERTGVDRARGVAIFSLASDFSPLDRGARLWAQTERARACARAAAVTGEALWREAAADAAETIEAFLRVPVPGLWRDRMDEAGDFREEPAPATSLYHLIGAIAELSDQAAIRPLAPPSRGIS